MPFQITSTVTCYPLPMDGPAAEKEFLLHLAESGEMFIIAYAFTMPQMIDQLLANHEAGAGTSPPHTPPPAAPPPEAPSPG